METAQATPHTDEQGTNKATTEPRRKNSVLIPPGNSSSEALIDRMNVIQSIQPTGMNETKPKTLAIERNQLTTAEGHNDTELDVHPEKAATVTVPHKLTKSQKHQLDEVLKLFIPAKAEGKLNFTTAIEHNIDTGIAPPVFRPQYNMSPTKLAEMKMEIKKMEEQGIISEIKQTAWRSPMIAVKKKDGGLRLVLDARELNKITIPNAKPIRDGNTIIAQLRHAKFKSTIDLSQAFHQILLSLASREKTAFAIGSKMYCYNRMTMGLRGSPATLATLIDDIFEDLYPYAFAYVDDFVIATETFEEHIRILKIIAVRLAEKNLAISPNKSNFCCKQLEFLGYILNEEGLAVNPEKTEAIREYPKPKVVKDVRRLLGAAGWYRRFIRNYAAITAPLTDLITTKTTKVIWNEQAEIAFDRLKECLASPPVLAMCDYDRPFKIFCDASDLAGAAILTQDFEEGNKPVFYHSFKFTPTQQRYSATERECLAVIKAIEKFRPYVEGSKFEVVTDHAALQWLMNVKDRKGRIARWAIRLQAYAGDMITSHRQGKAMEFPDALSRAVEMIEVNPATTDRWYNGLVQKLKTTELDRYKTENDLVYHRHKFSTYSGERLWTICVPKEQRNEVLQENHDQYSHPGIWRTMRRIRNTYHWPNLNEDVYNYVRKCEVCKVVKPSNENRNTPIGQFRHPEEAGNMLSIDIMGEWPTSRYNNKYVFVVIDCYTKYIWAKPMRNCTTTAVVSYLENWVYTTNGCPRQIISDNGVQFTSKHFENMCKTRGIKHQTTPRYHPKANPVESTNKTIKNAIKTYLANETQHSGWEDHFNTVIYHLNSTPHTATGRTPQYLHFGRELVNHANEYKQLKDINPPKEDDVDRKALIGHETADKIETTYENRRAKLNRTAKKRQFTENMVIYVPRMKLSNKAGKYAQKLAPAKIQGVITRQLGNDTYEVRGMNGKMIGKVHADDITIHAIEREQRRPTGKENNQSANDKTECYNCQATDHVFRQCPNDQQRIFCFRCGAADQMAKECDSRLCNEIRSRNKQKKH